MFERLERHCEETGLTKSSYVKMLLLANLKDEQISRTELPSPAVNASPFPPKPAAAPPVPPPKKAEEQPKKWYEGMPFRKGGAK
ncbi:hypothetical protein [Methanomassiliicoccus luminyensis]|uniref:hypothetical protein n=1 Tax=Methanomassiliicoccus luminyensis TaxID=1080712 RepID=UPI0012DE9B62|nr:hypothetical protein [Methanomassiliicoccus luminyensis]